MGFIRQEYWNGLPFPFPRDIPDPGIEHGSLALTVDSVPSEPPGMPSCHKYSLLTSSVYLPQSTWPVFWL